MMAKKKSKKKVEIDNSNQAVENQIDEVNLEDQVKEEKDKFLRLFAEFENYKRRTAKEGLSFSPQQVRKLWFHYYQF